MNGSLLMKKVQISNRRIGKVSIRGFMFAVIVFLFCLLVALILLQDNDAPAHYKMLFLLPLVFGVMNVILCQLYDSFTNIGTICIWAFECFRMVITPLIMRLGGYYSVMKNNIQANMPTAIALMLYECVVVYLTIWNESARKTRSSHTSKNRSNGIRYILFAMVAFLIVVAIFNPHSISTFKTIKDIALDTFTTWTGMGTTRFNTGTLTRVTATLFTMVFSWCRYLVSIAFIIWCKKRFSSFVAVCLSMIPIVAQMFFITATIMDSIVCAFVLLIVLAKIYPKYRSNIVKCAVGALVILIGVYFGFRFVTKQASNAWGFLSENAIAYASGIDNVAAMLNVDNESKWSSFFFNIYGAIPFNSTLFGLSGEKLAAIFNAANGRVDGHIPPTIGAGYYYYGFLLAPIESFLFSKLSIKFGEKAQKEKNVWKYTVLILISILCAMEFNAYNLAIVLNYITTLAIPLYFITNYSNDIEFEYSR